MKIRTRLLLFLLPTIIGSTVLISSVLSYYWYQEILDGFKTRLKSSVVSCAGMIDPKEIEQSASSSILYKTPNHQDSLFEELKQIKDELDITNLYVVPQSSFSQKTTSSGDFDSTKFLSYADLGIPPDIIKNEVYITPIYKPPGNSKKIMTGYAPIFDQKRSVIALMAADVSVDLIDKKLQEGFFIIFISAGTTILLMIATLVFIANKITHPVQKLTNAALSLAAGQYGEPINVKGPREIVELSHTLNTMSECLLENINRLKEQSLVREKMLGEYESCLLLQNYMLQKVIDECSSDLVAVKAITLFCSNPKGLLIDFPNETKQEFHIHLVESQEIGFEGMYNLLTHYKLAKQNGKEILKDDFNHLHVTLQKNDDLLHFASFGFAPPIIWSMERMKLLPPEENTSLSSGDLFFLCSTGLVHALQGKQSIEEILTKVLKFFAEDGLDICSSMLHKELTFLTKRKPLEEDIHILCFQRLY